MMLQLSLIPKLAPKKKIGECEFWDMGVPVPKLGWCQNGVQHIQDHIQYSVILGDDIVFNTFLCVKGA